MTGPGHAVITGATGLVGSALVRRLLDDGWSVTATVRSLDAAARIEEALRGARITELVDALDCAAVLAILSDHHPDIVFNCVSSNPSARGDAARAYGDGNLTVVAVILDACRRAGIGRAVVFGSGSEYAPADRPLDEDAPLGPTTLYGATKAGGTALASYFRRGEGLEVFVARPFSVYGPRERLHRLVPYVITTLLRDQPVEISSGTQRRDYLYVTDLADGLAKLAARGGSVPDCLNFTGLEQHTVLDVATIVRAIIGSKAPILVGSRPPNPWDQLVFLGDSRLARETLEWRPAHDLRTGLAATVEWYRSHRAFWTPSA
jgi:nucleoside-diphosphate-sugar epimerase